MTDKEPNDKKEHTDTNGGLCDHDFKCTYEGMDGERYRCSKCGKSYFLDYEDMK